jgi:hypothetical protein
VFTKITVVLAIAWVLVAGGSGFILRSAAESRAAALGSRLPEDPALSTGEDAGEAANGAAADAPGSDSSGPVPAAPAPDSPVESDTK